MQNEQILVSRVIAGDSSAEKELVNLVRPRLLRTTITILGTSDAAVLPVVEESIATALAKLKESSFGVPIYPWFRQICLRQCYSRKRELVRAGINVLIQT